MTAMDPPTLVLEDIFNMRTDLNLSSRHFDSVLCDDPATGTEHCNQLSTRSDGWGPLVICEQTMLEDLGEEASRRGRLYFSHGF